MDQLEKYIKDNRAAMDQMEPLDTEALWARIAPEEQTGKDRPSAWQIKIGRNWQWSIAASIAIAITAFLLWPDAAPEQLSQSIASYYPELAEQERNYTRQIAQKEADLNLSKLSKSEFREVFEELELLENLHQEYIKDIPEFGNNDRLVQALIKYYEHKIRILERLKNEVEKQKNHERLPHEREI